MAAASTRTARIELRSDPERNCRIRYAARLARQSVSAFVLDAAGRRAEEVIAASTATTVPARFFERLHAALDRPPKPNRALARISRAKRRVVQR
jgi:uncharacterized protein (DUF1778 family)